MRVWNGKLGQQAMAEMEKNGNLKYLGTIYRGLRQTTRRSRVYTPADLYGVKLRLPPIPTLDGGLEGGWTRRRSPLPLPELYSGLKSGKADASEGDLPQISSFKLDEVQSHLIMTNHLVQTGGMLINKRVLRSPVEGRPGPRRQGGEGGHRLGEQQDEDRRERLPDRAPAQGHAGGDPGRRRRSGRRRSRSSTSCSRPSGRSRPGPRCWRNSRRRTNRREAGWNTGRWGGPG